MKQWYVLLGFLLISTAILCTETVHAQTTCAAPTALNTLSITQTNATLTLSNTDGITGTYNIQYRVSGSSSWTTISNVALPYSLNNLTCEFTYEWQVQSVCNGSTAGNPITSDWSTSSFFTTSTCFPPLPPCDGPTGLSTNTITQTGAKLYLYPTSFNIGTFTIQYHTVNAPTWITLTNVSLPYTLSNLTCGTDYEWQVKKVCDVDFPSNLSEWSDSGLFSTLPCTPICNAPTGLSSNNLTQTGANLFLTPTSNNTGTFNIQYRISGTTSWSTVSNVSLPYSLTNLTCNSNYEFQVQSICTTSSPLVYSISPWSASGTFTTLPCTPVCNPPTGLSSNNVTQTDANLFLTPTANNTGTFNIQYRIIGTSSWTSVSGINLPYSLFNLACGSAYEWQVQSICTTSVASIYSISAWSASGTFTTLPCTPVCNAPSGLSSNNVTQTGASLYLNPATTVTGTINIRYTGGGNSSWTTLQNVTLPYSLSNLTCDSSYQWQVQYICTTSSTSIYSTSDWSTSASFTTLPCTPICNAPTGLSSNNLTQTGANLFLTPTSNNTGTFNIQYRISGTTSWSTVSNVSLPYSLTNLTCNSNYEFQVQSICTTSSPLVYSISPWSASGTFTTIVCPPICNAPTGLSSTYISKTSAYLYLTPTSTNTGAFNIQYRKNSSSVWTTISNVNLPFTLNNLICGTTYQWQVQKKCFATGGVVFSLSPWSPIATFSTSLCVDPTSCSAPNNLSVFKSYPTSVKLQWASVTNALSYIVYYRLATATNGLYTSLSTNTNSITLTGLTPGKAYTWQVQTICRNVENPEVNGLYSSQSVFKTTSLVATPNPANRFVKIAYEEESSQTSKIELRDSYGKLITFINNNSNEGLNEIEMDLENVSEGLYFIILESDNKREVSKIVIKH